MVNQNLDFFYIIDNFFFHKTGKRKYSYRVISHQKNYFVKYHFENSEVQIKNMLESFIDNIYVVVGGQLFQQSGVSMGTRLAPLLGDLLCIHIKWNFEKLINTIPVLIHQMRILTK
jgi:hypothetical protein